MFRFVVPVLAMTAVVAASNVLVQHPITLLGLENYLTWGAVTYPFAFLVTDLTNRRFGPAAARKVVYVGFALAVALSVVLATPRIALASGSAFLIAQLLDIAIFHSLRESRQWWRAPLTSSVFSSAVDTAIFFTLAFAATGIPMADYGGLLLPMWVGWAVTDYLVKLVHALAMLGPFRAISLRFRTAEVAAV